MKKYVILLLTVCAFNTYSQKSSEKPNVLFIIIDQLRFDAFSHRNNPVVKTPNIDKLAAGGSVFTQATCTSPVCGPSRAAMLSGCYAYDGKYITRNREMTDVTPFVFPIKTIDELLNTDGYHVEYRGKWHCGNEHMDIYKDRSHIFGHDMSKFNAFLRKKGYTKNPVGNGYLKDVYTKWTYKAKAVAYMMGDGPRDPEFDINHGPQVGILEVDDEHTMTAWTAQKTVDFLNDVPKDKPFAITCSILQPHAPLISSEKYTEMYNPKDMPLPKNLFGSRIPRSGKKVPIPAKVTLDGVKEITAVYYGLVKEVDDHVGRVLDALEENGLDKNTLVILTADHGEFLGSQNAFGKSEFYEESFRVPLIMRYPGKIKPGTKTKSIATGADIGPTILDYCGVAKPEWMHGRSLKGVVNGQRDDVEYAYGQLRNEQCLRSKDWKLVINKRKPYMFFDLANDPMEMTNLLDGNQKLTAVQNKKMIEMLKLLKTKYKMAVVENNKEISHKKRMGGGLAAKKKAKNEKLTKKKKRRK